MNPALGSSGFLGILGPCRFGELSPSLKSQNLHRPKIPKIPDGQSAGFMHRPKIPKNPKTFRNYQARNLGILGNLGPVHESCTLFIGILGNLGPVQVW